MFFSTSFRTKSFGWFALVAMLFAMMTIGSTAHAGTVTLVDSAGKCLDVKGGAAALANGALIEHWACSGQANQAWAVKDMGASKYEIIAKSSGKCLDIVNSGTANGTAIQQLDCSGKPNQLWQFIDQGFGQWNYRIVSVANAKCVDIVGGAAADGALAEISDCTGSANQTWVLSGFIPGQIVAKNSNKCLDVTGGVKAVADGTLMEQWSCSGLSNQSWTVNDMGNRQYQLVAGNSGKCLDLVGGGTGNGNRIQQSQCANVPSQLWTITNTGRNWNQVVSVAAKRCLDVTGGPAATADGAQMELWDCTMQNNQLWQVGPPSNFF